MYMGMLVTTMYLKVVFYIKKLAQALKDTSPISFQMLFIIDIYTQTHIHIKQARAHTYAYAQNVCVYTYL